MATPLQHPRLSAEEFEGLLLNHGGSFEAELIGGEVVVSPPDNGPASSARIELLIRLRRWADGDSDGGLLLANVFVKIDGESTIGPDLAWWAEDRRPAIAPRTITTVPDWVAEVLSPSTRENDLGPKRERYLAAGVRELWLVDPAARSVVVVDADGHETPAGERCASRVLDGFAVETAALFVT